jgi:hypothetical protein
MQELIEWIDNDFRKQSTIPTIQQLKNKAKYLLEKEKEQIIDAYVKGFDISAEGWNGEYGIKDFNNIKEEIKAEELYNQTYNL